MQIYEAIQSVLRHYANGYDLYPPYMEKSADINKGYITYYDTGRRTIVGRSQSYDSDGNLVTSHTEQVDVQLEVMKCRNGSTATRGAIEQAEFLKGALFTRALSLAFYECGYELVNVYEPVRVENYYNDNVKKWCERVFFSLRFYHRVEFITQEVPLKKAEIGIKSIG